MNLIDLTIDNWNEFIVEPGKKVVIIPSPRCDANSSLFHEFFEEYEGDVLAGIIYPDLNPLTGNPSRLLEELDIEGIQEYLLDSPSVMVFDGDEIETVYTHIEESTDEETSTIPAKMTAILAEIK